MTRTYYGSCDPTYSEVDREWDAYIMSVETDEADDATPDWRPWDEDTDTNLYDIRLYGTPEENNWAVALS